MGKVFIGYSHEDVKWINKVQKHFKDFERDGVLEVWCDQEINAGDFWREDIKKAISESIVAVLIVSQNFIASDFIMDVEVPLLLDRENKGELKIIPLMISPINLDKHSWIAERQATGGDHTPLIRFNNKKNAHKIESRLVSLFKDVEKAFIEIESTIINDNSSSGFDQVPIADGRQFRLNLSETISGALKSVDDPDFITFFRGGLELESGSDVDDISTTLLKSDMDIVFNKCLINVCEYYLNNKKLSVAFHHKFKQAVNDILGCYLFSLVNEGNLEQCCQVDGDNHYRIKGVSSDLGIEIALKRISAFSGVNKIEMQQDSDNELYHPNKMIVSDDFDAKWHSDDDVERAVVQIWRQIEVVRNKKLNGVVPDRSEYLSPIEKKDLNALVKQFRKISDRPRCFFISYKLDDREESGYLYEFYHKLLNEIPNLLAVGFVSDTGITIFNNDEDEYDIRSAIRYLYGKYDLNIDDKDV